MKILVTGTSGYIGSRLTPQLQREGHEVRGFARDPTRVKLGVPVVKGDAVSGAGLEEALEDIEVAYFLIHSMEHSSNGSFNVRERAAAENFARTAAEKGVERIVYLGGLLPAGGPASPHLTSRFAVEEILLSAVPCSVALRASIVIGATSRPFRFLVRLVERVPVLPIPGWGTHRTTPIDERDIMRMLVGAATNQDACGQALDVAGPEVVTYIELIERIRDLMLVGRPTLSFKKLTATPIASRVASAIVGEDPDLIEPLMESLGEDLLPRDELAAELLGVRLHSLDAAIEHALRDWEAVEPLAAR
jgi:uncharacterized protein YbjT (DUF2867 family)